MTKIPSVNSVLAQRIAAWPTLFKTREDALLDLCRRGGDWNHKLGFAQRESDAVSDIRTDETSIRKEMFKDRRENEPFSKLMKQMDDQHVLERWKKAILDQFTRDNAERIAELEAGFSYPPSFNTYHLNALPKVVAPEWKDALVELAEKILDYTEYEVKKYVAGTGYNDLDRCVAENKEAHKAAQELILRYAPEKATQEQKQARNEALEKLRYAAKDLGYELVKLPEPEPEQVEEEFLTLSQMQMLEVSSNFEICQCLNRIIQEHTLDTKTIDKLVYDFGTANLEKNKIKYRCRVNAATTAREKLIQDGFDAMIKWIADENKIVGGLMTGQPVREALAYVSREISLVVSKPDDE